MTLTTLRSVRRECKGFLQDLALPPRPTTDALIDAVAARRGRPLRLLDKDGAGEVCGVWISTTICDYVFVDSLATGLHRAHIVAHEVAHVAFDHGGPRVLSDDAVVGLLPDLDLEVVLKVLGRQSYGTHAEQQAEVFASLVLSGPPAPPGVGGREASPELNTLAHSLGSRTRRKHGRADVS